MIIDERESRHDYIVEAARQIMTAGRTAPQSKGMDHIEIVTLTGESICELAAGMRLAADKTGMQFFLRDADNIEQSGAVILVGSHPTTIGLNCEYCGYPSCAKKTENEGIPCALTSVDLGIALGAMAAAASALHIDNRIMFSAGYAAREMNLLPTCSTIFALPLSISSKSPFFDRKPKQ